MESVLVSLHRRILHFKTITTAYELEIQIVHACELRLLIVELFFKNSNYYHFILLIIKTGVRPRIRKPTLVPVLT